ncbi:uncharacterized protein DUF1871 [Fusobacterium naviforme]|nr:uncharacterized protein DUF1871 [Fusobacterium naviforme]STO27119.1 Uncharacterised protein [Fusobacterium naviforme]
MDVFRVIDRFNITGRGTVYTIQISKGAVLHMNDILCDLRGNRFAVKGFEMIRRIQTDITPEDWPVGIMFELLSGTEVCGNILVRDLAKVSFMFCNHPLYPRRVDEDYEEEYQAAGLDHPCALFSYEDFSMGKLSLYGEEISGLTIYRGWMLKPEEYRDLYKRLEKRGIILINTPDEYERYHFLPGWYEDFKDETPLSVWTEENNIGDILHVAKQLDGESYIVKDYVKSRKHEWYDACFVKNVKDAAGLERVVRNFVDRQGEDLVGGVVLRKFENLKKAGFHEQSGMPLSEEYRIFIYAGKVLAVDGYWNHSDELDFTDVEYAWMESLASRIKSNFVTMDLARKEDGTLIVMELGDGQVSGLQEMKAAEFYRIFRGQGIRNPYSIDDIKRIITTFTRLDIEPEMSLRFIDKKNDYMIIGYIGHVSFQRCGYEDASGEDDYTDLDSLFNAELVDGICLQRDWYKVTDIWCEPDMEDLDLTIEGYRKATERRKEYLGQHYQTYKAVKREIDRWNPYGLLPDAPHNEFNSESEDVARNIRTDSTVEKIAKVVSRVFSEAFEPQYFTVDKCMDVAGKIRAALDEIKECFVADDGRE